MNLSAHARRNSKLDYWNDDTTAGKPMVKFELKTGSGLPWMKLNRWIRSWPCRGTSQCRHRTTMAFSDSHQHGRVHTENIEQTISPLQLNRISLLASDD